MKNKVLPLLLVLCILALTGCIKGSELITEDFKNSPENVEQAEAQKTAESVGATPEPRASSALEPQPQPRRSPRPAPANGPEPASTIKPTSEATSIPTSRPTAKPTSIPTPRPTAKPAPIPSVVPVNTPSPTSQPGETESPEIEDTPDPDIINIEFLAEVENRIVELCNIERDKAGLGPLEMNSTLREIARFKSKEMGEHQYFAHESAVTGAHCWDLAKEYGYTYKTIGENIWRMYYSTQDPAYMTRLKAQVTADRIVADWMASKGHKKNILNPDFNRIGVGAALSSRLEAYAVQVFSD